LRRVFERRGYFVLDAVERRGEKEAIDKAECGGKAFWIGVRRIGSMLEWYKH
jgi:hypothetical protein